MRKLLVFFLLTATIGLQAQINFDASDLEIIAKAERDAHYGKLSPVANEATGNYDVKWHRCWWNVDPAINAISGYVTTLFTPVFAGLDSLIFDMNEVLQVDSVIYHQQQASWRHTSGELTIVFPATIPHQTIDSVSVYYHGVPPTTGMGSFYQSTHEGTPVIWTLSEPYGASDWWPCKNGLTDKADSMDIFIRTPATNKSASNGILLSAVPVGENIVYHWKHCYPIATYLVCLAVTNYSSYTLQVPFGGDTLEVVNYVYPEDSAAAYAQTVNVVPMIQLFDTLFGIYPFQNEKYGHAQFGWGGGMEHQTMTFLGSFGYELLAHELAHQWFGNKVTCGSWTDIWLNEGFGTYLSGLCYEHLAPIYWQRFRETRIKSIISKPGGSVYCSDTTNVDRIFDSRLSYAKGAMVLHQLRWLLGDSAFFAASNNYLLDVSLAYGFARTSDLKTHLETSSGQDLTWYFDDWFTGEGFPSWHLDWIQSGEAVSFTLNQTQSSPLVSFFEMVVPVQFKNATRDTIIRVSNTFSGQAFTANIPFTVDSVIIDPGYQLISGNNTIGAVADLSNDILLQVVPNPASDHVTFRFGGSPSKDKGEIRIYDHAGRMVTTHKFAAGDTEITLTTANFRAGLYHYLLPLADHDFSGKFMIIR